MTTTSTKTKARAQGIPQGVQVASRVPAGIYEQLQGICEEQGRSMAWVVREALTQYVKGESCDK